ncbi:hypothetical protein HX069_07265 [Myroides odoratimimus]|uniref:hypothetical protein n=1 Tax=Myroides odoratimimus TaxID=76832 RepID=UPI0025763C28|nr:hypothetical protein [Myroides odoratimimus]MDM1678955.1 hypothetical protein [Myroides odoratimimus]
MVAIIVTYLFSKLFTEKNIRIDRKKEIDELSLKITYLRQISFYILSLHDFWKFKSNVNVKSKIDSKYPYLTYEIYKQVDSKLENMSYEEWSKLNEDINGMSGQAYLALKGLQDGDHDFSMYSEIKPRNYSLTDIERYIEYSGSFWYFLDRSDDSIVNFNNCNKYWLLKINELYFKIMNKKIDEDRYKQEIKEMFSRFDSVFFVKHYFFSRLNSDIFPYSYKSILINMFIFVLILVYSLVIYVVNIEMEIAVLSVTILLSFFISNTIDLIYITIYSIRQELNIKEIFRI